MEAYMLLSMETRSMPCLLSQLIQMKPENSIHLISFDPVHSHPLMDSRNTSSAAFRVFLKQA